MTKRDIKQHERDLVTKQQMKAQLKEIRKLQATHLTQTEAQQRRHQKKRMPSSQKLKCLNKIVSDNNREIWRDWF